MELAAWTAAAFALGNVLWLLAVLIDRWWFKRRMARYNRLRPILDQLKATNDEWKRELDVATADALDGRDCRLHIARLEVFQARSTELFELAGVKPPK